jgi:HPt (histidine-containing phosphotransfer) domain-containing protein
MDDTSNKTRDNPEQHLDNLPVIDTSYALTHVGGSKEIANELLTMLIQWIPGIRDLIEKANERKDYRTIADYTHQIKGATSYCGTKRLYWISDSVNSILKTKQTDIITRNIKLLCREIDLLIETYEKKQHTDQPSQQPTENDETKGTTHVSDDKTKS